MSEGHRFTSEPLPAQWKEDAEVPGTAVIELMPGVYFTASIGPDGWEFFGGINDHVRVYNSEAKAWASLRTWRAERQGEGET